MGLIDTVTGWFHHNGAAEAAGQGSAPVTAPEPPSSSPAGAVAATITHRTLLIHGYSANGAEFENWKAALAAKNIQVATIEIGNYLSLNNEISIKDLGEAFNRALRYTAWSDGSKDDMFTFDAIVHSTGMLVLRQWLSSDPFPRNDPRSRVRRLKHLVGLAPATFGSPQGKQGRSWLGALVKGNKDFGPDFLNAGDMVLDGLELGSRYTWELAFEDMLCDPPMYDQGDQTPYVAVFIGNQPYTGLAKLASAPGTDGTVRWAGCALNTRLVELDFRREPKLLDEAGQPTRARISKWLDGRLSCPMLAVADRNHGSILSAPEEDTVARVSDFLLTVNSDVKYKTWLAAAVDHSKAAQAAMDGTSRDGRYGGAGWQQFVFHVKDDHGDGVSDYNVQLFVGDNLSDSDSKDFQPQPLIADAYSEDASYRCFYLRLDETMLGIGARGNSTKVWMELIASSGTSYLEYEAYYNAASDSPDDSQRKLVAAKVVEDPTTAMPNLVKLDLTDLGQDAKLFCPYTTTMVEIVLEREPTLLANAQVSSLFQFWQGNQTADTP